MSSSQRKETPHVLRECRRVFSSSPYLAIRQLTPEYREGLLIIRGRVPNYHTRQLALSLAQRVDGVHEVLDRISVS